MEEGGKAKTQQRLVIIDNLDLFMLQKTGIKGKKNTTKRKLCMKCLLFFKDDFHLQKYKLSCYNPKGNFLFLKNNSWEEKKPRFQNNFRIQNKF